MGLFLCLVYLVVAYFIPEHSGTLEGDDLLGRDRLQLPHELDEVFEPWLAYFAVGFDAHCPGKR